MVRVQTIFNVDKSEILNKELRELEKNKGFRLIDIKFTAAFDAFREVVVNDALIIFEVAEEE